MNLQGCLSRRSYARKTLKRYIIENRKELETEFEIEIPQNIKEFTSEEFSNWIFENAETFLRKRYDEDLMFHEIIDLVADFICCENNVSLAECFNV